MAGVSQERSSAMTPPSITAMPSAQALARSREAVSKSMATHGRGTGGPICEAEGWGRYCGTWGVVIGTANSAADSPDRVLTIS